MPSLEKLKQDFAGEPFEIVNIDVQEEREVVQDFMQSNGYSITVLLDIDGIASYRYSVRSHPMKFLIDPKGKIVGWARGYRQWDSEAMRMLIKKVSEGEQVADKGSRL